jgi:hypothetical protein
MGRRTEERASFDKDRRAVARIRTACMLESAINRMGSAWSQDVASTCAKLETLLLQHETAIVSAQVVPANHSRRAGRR